MKPHLYLFGEMFHTYHVFFVLSILISISVFFYFSRRSSSAIDKIYFVSVSFIAGIVGSKVFYFFENTNKSIRELFNLNNGFIFYGSLVGVFIAIVLLNWNKRDSLKADLAALAIASTAGMFLGKIGCFLAGCCYGYPTESKLGVLFNNQNTFAYNPSQPRFPIQLADSLINLSLFILLIILFQKNQKNKTVVFVVFIIVYASARFLTEFYRADISRGFIFSDVLSLSQFYSLLILILTLVYLAFARLKQLKI